jgi:hypothetical protein
LSYQSKLAVTSTYILIYGVSLLGASHFFDAFASALFQHRLHIYFTHPYLFFQIILALRNQVQQGNMTVQQALDRLAMMQAASEQRQPQPQQPNGIASRDNDN